MRMIFLSIIFILGCSVCSAPAGNHVFLCRKCSVIAIKNTRPNMSNCSSAGSHQWTDLGLEGEKIYLCQKCQKIVKMSSKPNTSGITWGSTDMPNINAENAESGFLQIKCPIATIVFPAEVINGVSFEKNSFLLPFTYADPIRLHLWKKQKHTGRIDIWNSSVI